jgi:hypothetical protein
MMKSDRFVDIDREPTQAVREAVYLLHGFAGNRLMMSRLARFLARRNYVVYNWKYSSVRLKIAHHADALRYDVERSARADAVRRIHFVTHSLGSIIVRKAFLDNQPDILGRIVMLAPPNGGSGVARAGAVVIGRLCPVLHELSSQPNSYVNRLAVPNRLEIGVIAASNDWVVRRHNTNITSQRDHIVVRGDHVRLPLLRGAAEQAHHFLRTGAFSHDRNGRRPGRFVSGHGQQEITTRGND